jgi:hypothetical protein
MYTWYGTTYTTSGTYTHTYQNASGCTHTATLNLSLGYTQVINDCCVSACDSYTWTNGVTYTANGTYYYITQNPSTGCAIVHTMCLTLYQSTASSFSTTACDAYTWVLNGQTYTTSGVYTGTSLNANGCTHTTTMNLTVLYGTSSQVSATACDNYTWALNGQTYTATGVYTSTSVNAVGCIHTTYLNLTINNSTTSPSSATACDTYTWAQNGMTYTVSGTYVAYSTNNVGCQQTNVLSLTINNSTTSTDNITACDSYVWAASGITYSASGSYTATSTNAAGCLHTSTLNLTINNSTSSTESATSCDSYTWACNGQTYTASGAYTCTYLNQNACVHTKTLNLTINYQTFNGNATTTQCNSYVWNGSTYTASGIYTYTSLNAAGCLNTATLYLTINYGSTGSTQVVACNSYTWNGTTYTASGTYVATFQNAAGCDSVHTLYLTLNNGVYVSPKVFLSGSYTGNGLMKDDLRAIGVLPSTEPYTALSFANVGALGYAGGESVSASTLAVTGNNAIVDWVHVEIRTGAPSYSIVATTNGLLQRDGDVVDVNGNALYFPTVCPGNYYVTVKHRNHLGVMTANTLALNGTTQTVDFTTASPVWAKPGVVNAARKTQSDGTRSLWAGDTRTDKNVKYNGLINDKEPVLYAVGVATPNNILYPVYRTEDVNMDARVKYNNTDNDKNFILSEIINSNAPVSTPNDILSQHTPN